MCECVRGWVGGGGGEGVGERVGEGVCVGGCECVSGCEGERESVCGRGCVDVGVDKGRQRVTGM